MTLTLPEHLLLIALHDHKGTVHPAAFLSIEHGLHGAVLAELRLQRKLSTTSESLVKRLDDKWQPTGFHPIDLAMKALEDVPCGATVEIWMETLDRKMPHLKAVVTEALERRGIVDTTDRERAFLPGSVTHPMHDETAEADMGERLLACVRSTAPPSSRVGTLLGLIAACNLVDTVFQDDDRTTAKARADWIATRDAIVRTVRDATAKSEGTWTP